MSVSPQVVRPRIALGDGFGIAIALAGLAVLLARPFVDGEPAARAWTFGIGYLAIGAASIAAPMAPSSGRHLRPALVLAIGLAAVGASSIAAGPPVPAPWGAAAAPLSLLAAVAEEALFRRVAYGRLERFGALVAIVGSASLFALVHLPAYGVAALPVDLGAGLLLSWQRWASGSWTVPAATHAAANLVAVLR
jgi:membrane protease YdiL (CAAX protease family)